MNVLAYPVQQPLLDTEQITSLRMALGGESSFAEDLIDTFEAECTPALDRLYLACKKMDIREMSNISHFMAGSASNIGLLRFSRLCRNLEELLTDGFTPEFQALPEQFKAEYAASLKAIREEFGLQ